MISTLTLPRVRSNEKDPQAFLAKTPYEKCPPIDLFFPDSKLIDVVPRYKEGGGLTSARLRKLRKESVENALFHACIEEDV